VKSVCVGDEKKGFLHSDLQLQFPFAIAILISHSETYTQMGLLGGGVLGLLTNLHCNSESCDELLQW